MLTTVQFYIAWVIVAIIWLWLTMLMATFYPLLDGGIQQTLQVYRGLVALRQQSTSHESRDRQSQQQQQEKEVKVGAETPSSESTVG